MLSDFRNEALSRQFNRNYQENPEPNVIRERTNTINASVDAIKTKANTHGALLRDLVEKHRVYNDAVNVFSNWLPETESKQALLEEEPISASPLAIQKQIDRIKVG